MRERRRDRLGSSRTDEGVVTDGVCVDAISLIAVARPVSDWDGVLSVVRRCLLALTRVGADRCRCARLAHAAPTTAARQRLNTCT